MATPGATAANPFAIFNDMEARRSAQAAQAENAARAAFQHLTYKTHGTGQMIIKKALMFQSAFAEPPAIVTGCVLDKLPSSEWAYPQVTAGVYKWKTNAKGYVEGAFVYFNVRCDPIALDGQSVAHYVPEDLTAEISYAREQLTRVVAGTKSHAALKAQLRKAQMDLRRATAAKERKKADPEITHHLLFQGVALKDLPENVTAALSF